jgi:hypothetical protein
MPEHAPPLHYTPITLSGPLRSPRQMLARQSSGGHSTIHDDAVASNLGFVGGPIEGPTHFSQFAPLLATAWGVRWFEEGCISAHYQNVVVEGEEVRAFLDLPSHGAEEAAIRAEKADGTVVLIGTANVGTPLRATECERRLASARPPRRLVILDGLKVGQKSRSAERVRMDVHTPMGDLYPFTFADKLSVITEPMPFYGSEEGRSPWGRPVIPVEMISVLAGYTWALAGFEVRQPSVALFLDQEIRLLRGPLLVDEEYVIEREIVGLSESKRTESYWTMSTIRHGVDGEVAATMLLHQGVLKETYPGYQSA